MPLRAAGRNGMNIRVLNGSPRKNGNTSQVLGVMAKHLEEEGHSFKSVDLNRFSISGCLGCAYCRTDDHEPHCIQEDGAGVVIEKLLEADLVIYASPVYYWGFTGQMKTFIDRTFCLYNGYKTPDHVSLVENKLFALVVTAGGGLEGNAQFLFTAFDNILGCYKARNAGKLLIPYCKSSTGTDMDKRINQSVQGFVKQLLSFLKTDE